MVGALDLQCIQFVSASKLMKKLAYPKNRSDAQTSEKKIPPANPKFNK